MNFGILLDDLGHFSMMTTTSDDVFGAILTTHTRGVAQRQRLAYSLLQKASNRRSFLSRTASKILR